MTLKYEKAEKKEMRETSESWRGEVAGFGVWIHRRSDGTVEFGAQPRDYRESGKIMMFTCYPRHVDDLERFAEQMPSVFKAIAAEMRAAGLNDLRSKWDKHDDAMKQWREDMHKASENNLPMPPFPEYES